MCGIAGYIGKKQVSESAINKTLDLMKNRGPDHQDWCSFTANDTNVYLLHNRLSIIDVDKRSNQPFSFNDATLVFNGEIYNYIEIREELKKQGHIFTTDSDTEVLLKAYLVFLRLVLVYVPAALVSSVSSTISMLDLILSSLIIAFNSSDTLTCAA